jgi:hypothetical protein
MTLLVVQGFELRDSHLVDCTLPLKPWPSLLGKNDFNCGWILQSTSKSDHYVRPRSLSVSEGLPLWPRACEESFGGSNRYHTFSPASQPSPASGGRDNATRKLLGKMFWGNRVGPWVRGKPGLIALHWNLDGDPPLNSCLQTQHLHICVAVLTQSCSGDGQQL